MGIETLLRLQDCSALLYSTSYAGREVEQGGQSNRQTDSLPDHPAIDEPLHPDQFCTLFLPSPPNLCVPEAVVQAANRVLEL